MRKCSLFNSESTNHYCPYEELY